MSNLFRFWRLSYFQLRSAFTSAPMDFIKITKTTENTFESTNLWSPIPKHPAFGGQLSAQSLAAGLETVQPDRLPNLVHTLFCNPGDTSKSITYTVECLKEGKNMSMIEVKGKQDGLLICTSYITASTENNSCQKFCYLKETIVEDNYIPLEEYICIGLKTLRGGSSAKPEDTTTKNRELMKRQYNILMENISLLRSTFQVEIGSKIDNRRQIKITILKEPKSQKEFALLMTLISDLLLVESALLNLNLNIYSKELFLMCSIDHNINFIRGLEEGENVIYYLIRCNDIVDSKALIEGKIVNKEGEALCTTSQQGLIILKK